MHDKLLEYLRKELTRNLEERHIKVSGLLGALSRNGCFIYAKSPTRTPTGRCREIS